MRRTPRSFVCSILTLCLAAAAHAQLGQLNPPPGPVTETGPHLGQIQPWRALNDLPGSATAVHVITQPGVYYMTEEINAGLGQSGVEINLDGLPPGEYYVCIISNGNPVSLSAGSMHGISYTDNVGHDETIEISSGSSGDVRSPISGATGDGVHCIGAERVILRGLEITNCEGDGVHLRDNRVSENSNILIRNVGGDGMDTVADLTASYVCRKNDSWVSISHTGGSGSKALEYHQLVFTDARVSGADGPGIEIHPRAFIDDGGIARSSSVRMHRCSSNNSGSDGVRVVPQAAGTYAFDLTVIDTLANTGNGICIENTVGADCTVALDGFDSSGNGDNGYVSRRDGAGVCAERLMNGRMNGNGENGVLSDGDTTYYKYEFENVMVTSTTIHGMSFLPGAGAAQTGADVSMDQVSISNSGGHGLHVGWSAAAGPFAIEMDRCRMTQNGMSGAFLQAADGCGIDNNCNSNGDDGLSLIDASGSFESGTFNNNGGSGVRAQNSSCWIRVSQCTGNNANGAEIQGGSATIDGGLFSNNAFSGIDMQGVPAGVIARVSASSNGEYGIWCRNSVTNCSVVDNNCNGNEGGIRVDGANNVVQRNTATIGLLGGITVAPGSLEGLPVDSSNINTHANPAGNVVR